MVVRFSEDLEGLRLLPLSPSNLLRAAGGCTPSVPATFRRYVTHCRNWYGGGRDVQGESSH